MSLGGKGDVKQEDVANEDVDLDDLPLIKEKRRPKRVIVWGPQSAKTNDVPKDTSARDVG